MPDEYMINRGWLNGSCSNSSWGSWSNSPHPRAKKSSINTLKWFKKKKKRKIKEKKVRPDNNFDFNAPAGFNSLSVSVSLILSAASYLLGILERSVSCLERE